ncbi:MAG: alpha-E domain-containing protein, partial [Ktedonobacteraceae bacterium]|nr:alpha-E domain-containing protein [Ktedonobacteraceae bacterium]
MLSRVADHLYWMSRYLERAEHTARLVDVSLYHLLDQKTDYAAQRWKRLYDSLRIPVPEQHVDDAYSVTQSLA